MRQILFWASALTISFTLVDAIAASPTFQSQQVAQSSENCRGRQILTVSNCPGDGLEPEEARLYQLINQYRSQNGLPPIPLSKSLTLVANRHVRDLEENIGELTHGWSDCPYDSNNQNTWPCMWEAPQRLRTAYPGRGYENAHGGSRGYRASATSALQSWQGSSPHNAVILNQGIWQNRQWNSLGIGIYKGYAVLWFGEEPDSANTSAIKQNSTIDNSNNNPPRRNTNPPVSINRLTPRVVNNYCGSGVVTQPTMRSDSHDSSPYKVWFDFRRGQEVSSSVCGRQYWVKDDGNHYNYGIPFVYLVDGRGTCVVPYLYRETNNGSLQVVRPAPECSNRSQRSNAIPRIQQPSDNQPSRSNPSEMLW